MRRPGARGRGCRTSRLTPPRGEQRPDLPDGHQALAETLGALARGTLLNAATRGRGPLSAAGAMAASSCLGSTPSVPNRPLPTSGAHAGVHQPASAFRSWGRERMSNFPYVTADHARNGSFTPRSRSARSGSDAQRTPAGSNFHDDHRRTGGWHSASPSEKPRPRPPSRVGVPRVTAHLLLEPHRCSE